ncbi:hypothetical protein ACQPXB_21165 [Amycolatopsis sp. CA-161197]|uniref:hypothetical protein n=1 Tax=Amycolatopsis sp. CA-161197 TaxID=3239922 RepID=UPI003D945B35
MTTVLYAPTVPTQQLAAGRILISGGRLLPARRDPIAESALILLSGYAAVLSGQSLRPLLPAPGDLIYVRRDLPYAVVNLSCNAAVLMLVVTTDRRFDSAAQPEPVLDAAVAARAAQLRSEHLERIAERRTTSTRRTR